MHEATSWLLVTLEAQLEPLKRIEDSKALEVVRGCEQAVEEIRNQVAALNGKTD